MRVRVVVADQSEVRFYDLDAPRAPLRAAGRLLDPKARLHERDLVSDRAGRAFSSARNAHGRRGAVAHHGVDGEKSSRKQAMRRFARLVGRELQAARARDGFDRIVLMAGPSFLGALRAELPQDVLDRVVAEVHGDLVHQADQVVRDHLPAQAFAS